MPPESLSLWLDGKGVIVEVGEGWDSFALANGGESCVASSVRGKPLRSFVTGDAASMALSAMLSRARVLGERVEHAYRCDSPTLKRFMRMTVELDSDLVRFDHRLLWTEPLSPPTRFVTARRLSEGLLARCSMCNTLKWRGLWSEPDDLRRQGGVPETCVVVYGVCPACRDAVIAPRARTA